MLGSSGEHKPRALYPGVSAQGAGLVAGTQTIFPLQVKQVRGADSRHMDMGVRPPDWRGCLRFVKALLYI